MNLTKVSAIAEILSSMAILVTLVFLVVGMRQNTLAVQGATREAMLNNDRALLFENVRYPNVVLNRMRNSEELTDEELVQLGAMLTAVVRSRENYWLQHHNGVIDETTWHSYRAPLSFILSTETTRTWWEDRVTRNELVLGFVEEINQILANTPILPEMSAAEFAGFE